MLWLLVDVPYSVPCAPMAKHILHQGHCVELRQVCPQPDAQLQRTHVIFDRCNTRINDATSCQRACEASMEYKLTMGAQLPQQQLVLSVTKHKVQLIDLIREELQKLDDQHIKTSLVITGRYPVPMEVRTKRIDLKTTHAEADFIIPQQVVALADMGCKLINVIWDAKDVCVIIAYFFAEESL